MPGFRKGGEYAFRVVPAGYEFLGPGNDVLYQVPRNYNDAIAKAHDIAYGQLQRKGINPYITFNAADEEFLNNLQPNDVATIAARWIFQGKKTLASFGILPSDTTQVSVDASGDTIMSEENPNKRSGSDISPTIDKVPKTSGMDSVAGNSNVLALAKEAPGGSAGNGQETAVSPYPRVQRSMFTETLTVELPWTGWFSMTNLDKSSPVVFKLRLNSPYNFLIDNTIAKQTINTAWNKGLNNAMVRVGQTGPGVTITANNAFPHTVPGATGKTTTETSFGAISGANIRPAYLAWMEKLYESYHVISNDWHIECMGTSAQNNGDGIALFTEYDSYTGSSTGNVVPTNRPLRDYMKWRNISEHRIGLYGKGSTDDGSRRNFSGTWTQGHISRNTRNEEDIKTWYATGAEPTPTWVDQIVLLGFLKDDQYTLSGTTVGFNFRVTCKWTVQFKDLRQFYRYIQDDATSASSTDLVIPNDVRQLPYTVEIVP